MGDSGQSRACTLDELGPQAAVIIREMWGTGTTVLVIDDRRVIAAITPLAPGEAAMRALGRAARELMSGQDQ